MNINPLRFLYFQLLLLQLVEYDLSRFVKSIFNTKGIPPNRPFRKPLRFTVKILLITLISLLLMLVPLFFLRNILFVLIFCIEFYLSFIFIFIANVSIFPIDYLIKNFIIFLAKNKINKIKNLNVIAIAGSYGKTGMKDIVSTMLSEKYHVLKTPESVNTPLGISQLILKKLTQNTQIFVVEMGEYYLGDIAKISSIVNPDIGIITGINESHFERLKSINNSIKTIFELAQSIKPKGTLILNKKDDLVKQNYKKFISKQTVYLYQNKDKFEFNENLPGYLYKNVPLKILGEFNLDKIDAATYVSKKLGLNENQIKSGLRKIKTPDHRLQPFLNLENNLLIIDDSYNGNPDGVEEAIKTLANFKSRRKIFITPGLVETGEKAKEIHQRIGKRLNDVADLVILVKNSVTPYIEEGLISSGFKFKNILRFSSMFDIQKQLKTIVKSGDVVLFQNDWPDNYV